MNASAVTGVGVSTELLQIVDELSTQLVRDRRDRERDEARRALRLGQEEANHMRDAAGKARMGAIVGGSLTAAGGLTQTLSACSIQTKLDCESNAALEKLNAVNARASAVGQVGGTVAQLGSLTSEAFTAASKFDEADAHEAAARAEATLRQADEDRAAADVDQQTRQKALEAFSRILELDHASTMAVLRG